MARAITDLSVRGSTATRIFVRSLRLVGHPLGMSSLVIESPSCVLRRPNFPALRCLSTADVDDGAPVEVRLGLPQNFMGDRCGVTLPEEDVAGQVHKRVTLRPAE